MQLIELEARFIQYHERIEPRDFAVGDPLTWRARGCPSERRIVTVHYRHEVSSLALAHGIHFLCPKCFIQNHGSVGTHWCEITFEGRGVKPDEGSHDNKGKSTRWTVTGTGLADLTTLPSILLQGGCNWHGYITKGEVT